MMRYSIVLTVSGIPGHGNLHDIEYDDVTRALEEAGLDFDESEPGDSEYLYLATESGEPDEGTFWHQWKNEVKDITASGVLSAEELHTLCDGIGAWATEDNTLGTLGGPLSGGMPTVVPDLVFRLESALIIESIRVTPFDPDWPEDFQVTEDVWNELKAETVKEFQP
jgi:hypothetical protein